MLWNSSVEWDYLVFQNLVELSCDKVGVWCFALRVHPVSMKSNFLVCSVDRDRSPSFSLGLCWLGTEHNTSLGLFAYLTLGCSLSGILAARTFLFCRLIGFCLFLLEFSDSLFYASYESANVSREKWHKD